MIDEWSELAAPKLSAVSAKATVPVRIRLSKRSPKRKPQAKVMLRQDIIDQLGIGMFCSVRIGKGARAHQISIINKPDGAFKVKPFLDPWAKKRQGGAVKTVSAPLGGSISLGVIDHWPDIDLPAMERPYKMEKEGGKAILVIDLPQVLWSNNPLRTGAK